ncbi:uncharacterized protein LOC111832378 [Capsella rubella]|uniref:uncharacterized protein LOC111832378 n=1 Tax=Capsella rubella TaxID=81985 RepID=UPI000CD4ECC7|nr:uncharacterized protein LOC111832378 [Capsella rubella]
MAIPMIKDIKKSLTIDGSELTIVGNLQTNVFFGRTKKEDMDEFPIMTFEELLQATEVGLVRTLCTVKENDTDYSWFYYACKICNKKTIKEDVIKLEDVNAKPIPRFWCEVCKDYAKGVSPKFWIHLNIIDHTGETRIMMFVSFAEDIVGTAATEIIPKGSFDLGSLMISDGVETSEVGISNSSTPSSKRDSTSMKEGDVQSSTSKKQCSKMGVLDDVKVATKDDKEKHKLD